MDDLLFMQRKVVPEMVELLETRCNIIRKLMLYQPIGRRNLAEKVNLSERILRSQVEFLKKIGLIEFSPLGMSITDEGRFVLVKLDEYVKLINGLSELEENLAQKLNLKKVYIVDGDCDESKYVFRELGHVAAKVLEENILKNDENIAISGGTTMKEVAESVNFSCPLVKVVPARGGLTYSVEFQANNIAALLASKLDAFCYQLYLPDHLSKDALAVLLKEDKELSNIIKTMQHSDIIIHGISTAKAIGERRNIDEETIQKLEKKGAIGEALGKYYTIEGKEVSASENTALLLDDFSAIGKIIAVAGGRKKASAILSVCLSGNIDILVTDRGAAEIIDSLV